MTVKELCAKHNNMAIWLCPSICRNQAITPRKYECGLEYASASSIPLELQTKEVKKYFKEDNMLCIIWNND